LDSSPTSNHPTILPNSDTLASMLLDAAETAASLQAEYWAAWNAARTARVNHDLLHDSLVADAYIHDSVEGKNAEHRAASLSALLAESHELAVAKGTLRHAESEVKRIEGLLEAARVHRSALHDMVALRVAELGSDARAEGKMVTALDCINSVLRMAVRAVGKEAPGRTPHWRDLKA